MTGEPRRGWVDPAVAGEFPELELVEVTAPHGSGRSAPEIRERLRFLSGRMRGAEAVATRASPLRLTFDHAPVATLTPHRARAQ